MAKKIDATMSTEVALDTLKTSNALSDLKLAVKAVTSSYKAQTAELKANGELLKAAETRYKGLGEQIKSNQNIISRLKDKQNDLNVSTKKGADQYLKYQDQIDKTTTKVASLTRQQEKSKSALEGYRSGNVELERTLKNTQSMTDSFVTRLKAEGKEFAALKAQSEGLKKSISSTNAIYQNQVKEVDKTKKSLSDLKSEYAENEKKLKSLKNAGKSTNSEFKELADAQGKLKSKISNANEDLQTQTKRLNKTATNAANFKRKLNEVETAEKKLKPSGITKISGALDKVITKGEKTNDVFGKILGAHIVAAGVTNALGTITSNFTELVKAGSEYNNEQQKMQATWKTLTGSAKDGDAMVGVTNQLSVAMGQSVELTDELNQQFYHVFNEKAPTEELTKSVLTMADAVGLTDENTKNLGLNFTHMMSSSKMQLGDFNHISDALPMYGEALLEYERKNKNFQGVAAKSAKVSTEQVKIAQQEALATFDKMHKSSKVTASDLDELSKKGLVGGDQYASLAKMIKQNGSVSNSTAESMIRDYQKVALQSSSSSKTQVDNSKLTMSQLRDAMSAGKVSAKDAEAVMNSLGKKYSEASENLMQTIPGMTRVIKSRIPALLGDIEKPFTTAKNPILGAVSRWSSDKKTEKEFTALGKATTKGLNTIIQSFSKASGINGKNTPKVLDSWIQGLTKSVTKFSDYIAKHSKDITSFFKIFANVSTAETKVLFATLKAMLPVLNVVGDFADKHPKLFGDMFAGLIITNTSLKVFGGLLKPILGIFKGFDKVGSVGSKIVKLGEDGNKAAKLLKPLAETMAAIGGVGLGKGLIGKLAKGGKAGKAAAAATGVAEIAESALTKTSVKGGEEALLKTTTKAAGKSGLLKSGLKALGKGAMTVGPLDLIASATDLIGINKKNAGKKVGNATGNLAGGAAGAAIGTAILPGIGTVLGGIGGSLLGEKLGGKIGSGVQKSFDKNKPKLKVITPKVKVGVSVDEKSVDKKLSKFKGDLNKSMLIKMQADPSSYAKTKKDTDKLFKQMNRSVDDYYKKKESSEKKDLDKLVKSGNMTKDQENKILAKTKAADKKQIAAKKSAIKTMQKDTNAYYKKVESIENGGTAKLLKIANKYGTKSKQYEAEKNKELKSAHKKYVDKYIEDETKLNTTSAKKLKQGTKQQVSIYSQLVKSRGKLNAKDLSATKKNAQKQYDAAVKPARKQRDDVIKAANKQYNSTKKTADHQYKDLHTLSKKQYEAVLKNADKQRDDTTEAANKQYHKVTENTRKQHKAVNKEIKEQKDRVTKEAKEQKANVSGASEAEKDAVAKSNDKKKKNTSAFLGTIGGWINGFVSGLSKVLSFFSPNTKVKAGKMTTKYATGTGLFSNVRRPIVKPTLAMLNDGYDSPETNNQEMVLHPNGQEELIEGRNTLRMLEPGAEVLNAKETSWYMKQTSKKFASGTGLFSKIKDGIGSVVSGAANTLKDVVGSAAKLFKLAGQFVAHPVKSFEALIPKAIKPGSNPFFKKTASSITKKVTDAGKSWWTGLWNYASSLLNGDGAGGPISHSPGAGWKVTSGFGGRGNVSGGYSQHDGVDFSGGKTVHSLMDSIVTGAGAPPAGWGGDRGIGEWIGTSGGGLNLIYQELNGKYGSGAKLLVKKGDHVKQGQAIAELGPSGTHVHIGATKEPMFSISGSSTKGWLDVTKLKGTKKESKKDKGNKSFYEKQLGSGFFKVLAGLGAKFGDAFGGGDSGGNAITRAMIAKAEEVMKVPTSIRKKIADAIIKTAISETGNKNIMQTIHDMNSGGNEARGPLQFTPGTFRAFAVKGHTNISSPYDQVLAALNNSDYKNAMGWTTIWGHRKFDWLHSGPIGHRRFENGGLVSAHQMVEVAEGNKPEMIIPLDVNKRSRGWELFGKVAARFAGNQGGSNQVIQGADTSALENKLDNIGQLLVDLIQTIQDKPVLDENGIYNANKKAATKVNQLKNYALGNF